MERLQFDNVPDLLRYLAQNLDSHDIDQRGFLTDLLLALADGVDLRAALGTSLPNVAHRPEDPLAPMIRAAVQIITDADPKHHKGKACETVRNIVGKDGETVRKIVDRAS